MLKKDVGLVILALYTVAVKAYAGTDCPSCTPIFQIQGNAEQSSYQGQRVTTQGVVTFWSNDHKFFWIQDPIGDGDTATSDAIMVASRGATMRPSIGDSVRVTAMVQEYTPSNGWPVTRLVPDGEIVVLANAQKLPAAVQIANVPTTGVIAAVEFWRAREGMRVQVLNSTVVGPTEAGSFVVLPTSDDDNALQHALVQPRVDGDVDYHSERIFVAAKTLQLTPLKVGDRVKSIEGVIDFRRGHYEVLADDVKLSTLKPANPLLGRNSAGDFSIVSFNVENFFDLENDPITTDESSTPTSAQFDVKVRKLGMMVMEVLKIPAILVLQEVENQSVLQHLGDVVNAKAGTRYVATSFASSDARGIEVAMLWDANQVELERAQSVTASFFNESTGKLAVEQGREPLLCWFRAGELRFAVVGVHLKSKLGDEPLFGTHQPPHRGTEELRKQQAAMVRALVEWGARTYPDLAWVVAGDFNDFSFAEPGEGIDHPLAVVRAEQSVFPLMEVTDWVPLSMRYTYIFEGNAQQLDHMLISNALKPKVASANIIHANADFPESWAQDPAHPWRVSDHDIIELRLEGVRGGAGNESTRKGVFTVMDGILLVGWYAWIFNRRKKAQG